MNIKVDTDLELSLLHLNDANEIFNTINSQRDYLGKWLPFVAFTKDVKDTKNYINSTVNSYKNGLEYVFTIRKSYEFAGIISLKQIDKHNKKTEIGYWLSEHFQKKGIMTASVTKICDFAFDELGLNRIQIKCAVSNISSKSIPERLGFTFEGVERQGELLTNDFYTDLEIYSKLKAERY